MFLITGCPRSGTVYIAEVLRAAGLDVGHEKTEGKDGQVDWHRTGVLGGWYPVLHQVRHPLRTIESLHSINKYSWGWVRARLNISQTTPLTLRCMQFWYQWNMKCEYYASRSYRVEDRHVLETEILPTLGVEPDLLVLAKMDELGQTTNTRRKRKSVPDLTWKQLYEVDVELSTAIRKLANKYGYYT